MNFSSLIYVAGGGTMESKALLDLLIKKGYKNIINLQYNEPLLTDYNLVNNFFLQHKPEYVFIMAGKSGGIKANQEMPATLMLDNLKVITNIMELSHKYNVKKLLYVASSCTYPKFAKQPMSPEMLMTGHLEPTNSAYATAKIAGIELCKAYNREYGCDFISAIPANLFGPGDDFSDDNSHVISAIIKKMHRVKVNGDKSITLWGTGEPKREFIFINDLADACIFLMNNYSHNEPINIGSGNVVSIFKLASIIAEVLTFKGEIKFDTAKPNGMPEKTIDSNKLFSLGWSPSSQFKETLLDTYNWYLNNYKPKVTI